MEKTKFTTYLLYAIGEIVLVVIGILIAVSLNNWNQARNETAQMNKYYGQIILELEENIIGVETSLEKHQFIAEMNERSLMILKSDDKDSLANLSKTLGALGTAWRTTITMPVFEEFVARGYLSKCRNDSLKIAFRGFKRGLKFIEYLNKFTDEQYQHKIEPFFYHKINYSEVALEHYQEYLVTGGPETDFASLRNNLEAWNIITLKLETTKLNMRDCSSMLILMKDLRAMLQDELQN